MPIKTQSDLPAKEILEKENIFVMDENRATHQDIRPINIAILNLMPLKEETELQLLRSLSNTPLQVDVTFVAVASHESKNTSMSHLNKFYETFSDIKYVAKTARYIKEKCPEAFVMVSFASATIGMST